MTASPHPAAAHGPYDTGDFLGRLGGDWRWALGSALVTLVLGILILVWPDATLHVVAVVVGLQLLIIGAFRFVTVFSATERGPSRLTGILVATLAVLGGVLCLRHPLQTIAVLSLILGTYWLVSGMLTAFVAISDRDLPMRGLALAFAGLAIVAGLVVLAYPAQSAVALARLLGLWLVLLGLVEAATAIALRARGPGARAT
jgi:uncharacterized membrane protein HdeD (DUF308 family)